MSALYPQIGDPETFSIDNLTPQEQDNLQRAYADLALNPAYHLWLQLIKDRRANISNIDYLVAHKIDLDAAVALKNELDVIISAVTIVTDQE
jgi:hypothetical protein